MANFFSFVAALCLLPSAVAFMSTQGSFARSQTALWARQPIIAGNWKMNPRTLDEAKALSAEVAKATDASNPAEVLICVPFPYLETVGRELSSSPVKLAAQSCYFEDIGAFTGSVSSCMVKSMGCEYVLAGHSERRTIFRDKDNMIAKKVRKILDAGLNPILCIGESFEEYQAGLANEICRIELAKDLRDVSEEELDRVVIAYEPCWAIGTGLTCSPQIAQKVHKSIRAWFASKYSSAAAEKIRIQYGGSVTPETVSDLMRQPDIDGVLVGGASLDGKKFAGIINYEA